MIIINHHRVYADLRLFNPIDQKISVLSEVMSERPKIHGYFDYLGGVQFVLYRQQRLILSIGATNYAFDDLCVSTNTVSRNVTNGQISLVRHIKIEDHNKIIFESDYNEISPMFERDLTSFIEVEHFDFGLFLENLSKNKEKGEQYFTDE